MVAVARKEDAWFLSATEARPGTDGDDDVINVRPRLFGSRDVGETGQRERLGIRQEDLDCPDALAVGADLEEAYPSIHMNAVV